MAPSALVCLLAALALAACGQQAPLPPGCLTARVGDVLAALRHAPGAVALRDGTRLSTCVARAVDDADLETVGATLTAAADRLARTPGHGGRAAFRLGFLIGAVERGAAHSGGVHSELSARIHQAASLAGGRADRHAALLRGEAAGRRAG